MENYSNKPKQITNEMYQKLLAPLPEEAVTKHPTKTYLSNIKNIYVVERLNDVFGVGRWYLRSKVIEKTEVENPMVVVKTWLHIPEYGIKMESYGGNDNKDLGDAYKGAVSDAFTKIASYLGVGIDVFKGKQYLTNNQGQHYVDASEPKKKVSKAQDVPF